MKKRFAAVNRASVLIMTLVSLALFWQSTHCVYASEDRQSSAETGEEPEEVSGNNPGESAVQRTASGEEEKEAKKRIMKTIPLDSEKISQIPRYIVEENTTYVLDESSIVVEETGKGNAEGADVVTVSRKVEDLPDNDLARIEKTMLHGGITCELLRVVYNVEEEDENGIPTRYSAFCVYGGLKKYSLSYPAKWQMTVWYDLCETEKKAVTVTEREEYEYAYVSTENGGSETENGEERAVEESGKPPKRPEAKKFRVKPMPETGGKKRKRITNIPVPLAATAAGTGVALPFIIWFTILTAPLFALKKEGKYGYIGRIRLKKKEGVYIAYLTKRLFGRAELPVFLINLPGKVWKRSKTGEIQVHCPDGKKIILTTGKTIRFTVEGD